MIIQHDFSKTTATCGRLLVVDDEPYIRIPVSRALSALGYAVHQAGSGQEALACLQQSAFDLMLLDMHLPDLDGLELLQRVRQMHQELPVIVLTGHPSTDNAIASLKLNVADYLCKPADIDTIASTVVKVLQKRARQNQQKRLIKMIADTLKTYKDNGTTAWPAPEDRTSTSNILHVPPLTLNRDMLQVRIGDEETGAIRELSQGEAAILTVLMTHPGQIVSCDELASTALEYSTDGQEAENIIRPYIFRLRRKLETNPKKPQLIQTIRGRGYLLSDAASR